MRKHIQNKGFFLSPNFRLIKNWLFVFAFIFTITNYAEAKAAGITDFIQIIKSKIYKNNENQNKVNKTSNEEFALTENSKNLVAKDASITKQIPAEMEDDGTLSSAVGPVRTSRDEEIQKELIEVYEVKNGDTLKDIAKLYDVSMNTIKWANDIKNSKVTEGDILIILPVDGIKYTVKKDDTLKSLAKKYKSNEEDIADFNEIKNGELTVGDEIIIPNGELYVDSPNKNSSRIAIKPGKKILPSAGSGYYMRPVIGGIKTQGIHGHNGVDIGIPVGSSLYAAADGIVQVAKQGGFNGGYGSMIIISHPNGTQTVYGHLTNVYVTAGQKVAKGEQIGTTGNSGRSTGPHLHFEVRGASNPF